VHGGRERPKCNKRDQSVTFLMEGSGKTCAQVPGGLGLASLSSYAHGVEPSVRATAAIQPQQELALSQ
jgi:hypothetical protein